MKGLPNTAFKRGDGLAFFFSFGVVTANLSEKVVVYETTDYCYHSRR